MASRNQHEYSPVSSRGKYDSVKVENIDNQLYVLTKQSFEQKADKLRKTALKISGNDSTAYLILEEIDYINGIGQKIEKIIHSSSLPIKHKMVNKEKVFYY